MAHSTFPKLPPLLVNGTKTNKYVCTYENVWDKAKKRSTRDKTVCVGKFVADKNRPDYGEILFNESFKNEHPQLENFRVFRSKGGRLEFKLVDEDNRTISDKTSVRQLHGGATWALNQIVGQSCIGKALKKTFPHYAQDRKLLSLIYFLVLEQSNAMYNYEEFAECTWLPYRGLLTSAAISRLFSNIKQKDIEKFLMCMIAEKKARAKEEDRKNSTLYLALDSTSISSLGGELTFVEYGHNKDGVHLPQANVLLVVDQADGMPLYYRVFDGNVPDVKTIRNTLADFARLDFIDEAVNIALVSDRGYISESNIADCLINHVNFVFNTKVRAKGGFARGLAEEHYLELLDINNYDPFLAQSTVTVPVKWYVDPYPVKGKRCKKSESHDIYAHLYFSKKIYDNQYETLIENLTGIKKKYEKDPKTLDEQEKALLSRFMTCTDEGKIKIIQSAVNDYLKLCGVRVLVSDCISDPIACHQAYLDRNRVEYAFNTLKSRLACNRLRVHENGTLRGKMFVQILATSVASMIRNRITRYNETARLDKNTYRVCYDSDEKLLAKLNNIMVTSFRDGWYFGEVAGKRAQLFNILGVKKPQAEEALDTDNLKITVEEDDPVDEDTMQNLTGELL